MTVTIIYRLRLICLLAVWAVASTAVAQRDPDADIVSEIVNTSINVFINADDSIQLSTIIDPGSSGDVDILITAISRDVDPRFDPDMEVTTLSGSFLAANDDWERPLGDQQGFLHEVIRCFVEQGIINPGPTDAVVLLSVSRAAINDTRIVADIRDADGLIGRTVASFSRVDGTLFDTHPCSDI